MSQTLHKEEKQTTQEPDQTHFRHPTDINKSWCGEESEWTKDCKPGTPTIELCIICADLLATYGNTWWWRVHWAAHPNCDCRRP